MTEKEREELIEKMARATWPSDIAVKWDNCPIWLKKSNLDNARATLAVAEPVIREQCAEIAEQRLITVGNGKDEYSLACKHIAAAIREGGNE